MEVSSSSGFRQFHEEGGDGGPHVSCRHLGGGGRESMERAEGARPEMVVNNCLEDPDGRMRSKRMEGNSTGRKREE